MHAGFDSLTLGGISLIAIEGSSPTLDINFVANPIPVFTVNSLLPNVTIPRYAITGRTVMLMDLMESNSGNYSVQGMNFANTRMAEFQLIVVPCECIISCMVVCFV